MIPCKNTCPDYFEGCHKTCARWRTYQDQNRLRRQAQKAYLEYQTRRCNAVIRQCQAVSARPVIR